MSTRPRLFLDANILVRSVLGNKVADLVDSYSERINFLAPQSAWIEAERSVPKILEHLGRNSAYIQEAQQSLSDLRLTIGEIPMHFLEEKRETALKRIAARDPDDWPILAASLVLDSPIWTEDQDFFGTGVPTWTTEHVEIYLKSQVVSHFSGGI